jgi:hypothetical protein
MQRSTIYERTPRRCRRNNVPVAVASPAGRFYDEDGSVTSRRASETR